MKKHTKKVDKPTKAPQNFDCSSVKSAEAKTGMPRELILALIKLSPNIQHASNRIDSALLIRTASENPELVKQYSEIPNIHVEKALRERIKRQLDEAQLEQTLKNLAPIDLCRRILTRGGHLLKTKLMNIPDRTSERFALETDALKIRETMVAELAAALGAVSEEGIEKLIKEVLDD